MIRFICKETCTCPEGEVTGIKMATFTNVNHLEYWLTQTIDSDYTDRMLIGCEVVEETKGPN